MTAQVMCSWGLYLMWGALAATVVYGVVSTWADVKDFVHEIFGI